MAEKISVQIALEGGQEIVRQLDDIGAAGQKAFADIAKSADKAGSFSQIKPEQVTASLKKMGVEGAAAINKVQAAVQSAVRLERIAGGVAAIENGFVRLRTVGATAFTSLATSAEKLGQSLTRSLGPLAGAARALGPVGIAAAGAGAGSIALVKFAAAAEDAFKALKPLQNASGDSLENISALAIAFTQGGTSVKDFGTAFGNLSVQIADASRTMADDIAQSSLRIEQSYLSVEQATLGLESAERNLQQARMRGDRLGIAQAELQVRAALLAREQAAHAARVAEANDLSKIIKLYEKMGQGVKVAFNPLTTQATKNAALLATLAKAGNNWKFVLADILKTATELERIQIGKALGLSPEMISTLSGGSAKLQEMARRAQELGIALNAVDQANLQQLIDSQNEASSLFDAIKQKIGALVSPALASFWKGFTQRLTELIPVFLQIGESIGQMDFSSIGAAAADFLATIAKIAAGWAAMLSGKVSIKDVLGQMLQEAGQIAVEIGVAIGKGIISGIIQAIKAGIGSIWEAIKGLLGGMGADRREDRRLPTMASGGLLGGRGTGTSDSNLAWLSRGEYVTPARAVSQPGVLSFLEALRRSGGNLSRVLDGMGRFALGGMVRGPIPAFAAGGLAGGSNVTIQFPGLPAIGGLRASADVVDQLHRAAAMAQVRSGGRKPSRYA